MKRPGRPAPGPRSTAGRLGVRVVSLSLRHRGAITNTQRPGYRTAEPSDSPPRGSRYAPTAAPRSGPVTACSDRSRTDPAGRGRSRPWRSPRPPYFPALRRSPHCGGRSTPSRDKPLTARLVARRHWRAFRSAGAGRDYQLQFEPIVCPSVSTACAKAPTTTGRALLASARPALIGTAIAPSNIRTDCAADVSLLSAASPPTFRAPTAGSPSAAPLDAYCGPNADSAAFVSTAQARRAPLSVRPLWLGVNRSRL